MSEPASIAGTVRGYDAARRFGWIVGADQRRYFVHRDDVTGAPPQQGEQVRFIPAETTKGPRATAVQRLGAPPPPPDAAG